MLFSSAEAKTSAVPRASPLVIDSTRSDDAPKLNSTVVPGLAASKSAPISVKASSVSEEAAKTVMVCASAPAVVVVAASPDSATSLSESDPQATRVRGQRGGEAHGSEPAHHDAAGGR